MEDEERKNLAFTLLAETDFPDGRIASLTGLGAEEVATNP